MVAVANPQGQGNEGIVSLPSLSQTATRPPNTGLIGWSQPHSYHVEGMSVEQRQRTIVGLLAMAICVLATTRDLAGLSRSNPLTYSLTD